MYEVGDLVIIKDNAFKPTKTTGIILEIAPFAIRYDKRFLVLNSVTGLAYWLESHWFRKVER
ncbi:hypothetical protein CMI47_05005 [Candidatus Pacearchaeota archaeon]|nr:hypothetical protein [Candidatus Pacearchaeota archaeon]|tara:strand:- start:3241 stop:3426 length:186 start_codon:yes stop_codon:yes gene_type:complete